MESSIRLAHGNGGLENQELIEKIFFKNFQNSLLRSEDSAIIEDGKLAFTTDSFTVSPIFFNGGDIGKISICGTCNDIAMMGAKPKYLTCSVIIEEGFKTEQLQKIVSSMRKELEVNGAVIVAGDTKVVPRGSVDKIFINTTAIGEVLYSGVSSSNLKEGMSILVSRDIGTHGATIFLEREGIEMDSSLKSDCASLFPTVKKLLDENIEIVAMRDATRGGVSAVLNEWSSSSSVTIEIEEEQVPIADEVQGACEMLGFEAYNLANEGTFILAVPKYEEQRALEILKGENPSANIIGTVTMEFPKKVLLKSSWGTKRFLELPTGELLPRIC